MFFQIRIRQSKQAQGNEPPSFSAPKTIDDSQNDAAAISKSEQRRKELQRMRAQCKLQYSLFSLVNIIEIDFFMSPSFKVTVSFLLQW